MAVCKVSAYRAPNMRFFRVVVKMAKERKVTNLRLDVRRCRRFAVGGIWRFSSELRWPAAFPRLLGTADVVTPHEHVVPRGAHAIPDAADGQDAYGAKQDVSNPLLLFLSSNCSLALDPSGRNRAARRSGGVGGNGKGQEKHDEKRVEESTHRLLRGEGVLQA
jgi:hypothetical protein